MSVEECNEVLRKHYLSVNRVGKIYVHIIYDNPETYLVTVTDKNGIVIASIMMSKDALYRLYRSCKYVIDFDLGGITTYNEAKIVKHKYEGD